MIAALIMALIAVESGGDNMAVGDGGRAVGCLQIHAVMVREVNRLADTRYTWPDDCRDRAKSIEMATIYLAHYIGTPEQMARRWNGGPNGDKKASTLAYWRKVEKELRK